MSRGILRAAAIGGAAPPPSREPRLVWPVGTAAALCRSKLVRSNALPSASSYHPRCAVVRVLP